MRSAEQKLGPRKTLALTSLVLCFLGAFVEVAALAEPTAASITAGYVHPGRDTTILLGKEDHGVPAVSFFSTTPESLELQQFAIGLGAAALAVAATTAGAMRRGAI